MPQKRSLPLWGFGLLCLFAAPVSALLMPPVSAPNTAQGRGEIAGRAAAQLVFVVAGIVLIVVHFVRTARKRQTKAPSRRTALDPSKTRRLSCR